MPSSKLTEGREKIGCMLANFVREQNWEAQHTQFTERVLAFSDKDCIEVKSSC